MNSGYECRSQTLMCPRDKTQQRSIKVHHQTQTLCAMQANPSSGQAIDKHTIQHPQFTPTPKPTHTNNGAQILHAKLFSHAHALPSLDLLEPGVAGQTISAEVRVFCHTVDVQVDRGHEKITRPGLFLLFFLITCSCYSLATNKRLFLSIIPIL
jgi:hypothetical protein